MTAGIIAPGEIAPSSGEPPFLRLPERDLFQTRAARLDSLAAGHALGDYLRFLAALARAQHSALARVRAVPLPDSEQMQRCRAHGMAPLGAQVWKRDPVWREALRQILAALEPGALPEAARAAILRLQKMEVADLERLADAVLAGDFDRMDRAAAPFVAAALQLYWLHMATSLGSEAFARLETHSACPVCASAPVASVVHIGGDDHGLRYLTCSLCGAQWHTVRVKCALCESTQGISYYGIEGGSAAVKAENCEACKGYLKILYLEKDPNLEAVADDVASVALDVLMAESGAERAGINFYLLGGDA
ncbi:MAG: formate dehydrogenase accessory protein FdhE [Gammaproteobacteria bacterium]|nr:formate dehydrogenase accessory protein FdhE [Gammaproteobacteria bacterium]